jgi:hypothetical protein
MNDTLMEAGYVEPCGHDEWTRAAVEMRWQHYLYNEIEKQHEAWLLRVKEEEEVWKKRLQERREMRDKARARDMQHFDFTKTYPVREK